MIGPQVVRAPTVGIGAAFPATPVSNRPFFRTDLGMEFYYDGTRWLCSCLHVLNLGLTVDHALTNTTVTGDNVGRVPVDKLYDVWLVDLLWMALVRTTNSGSAYWTVTLKKYTPGGVGTTIVTDDTSADTVAQFTTHRKAIGALVQSSAHAMMQVEATKTSTPGVPDISAYATFRYVTT